MPDIHVIISAGEEAASGLEDNEVVYPDATAEEGDAALLLVSQGDHILSEFPAGRYVSWSSV